MEGKNSRQVVYGISQKGGLSKRGAASAIRPEEVAEIAQWLREEGAYDYSQQEAQRLTHEALATLEGASPGGKGGPALFELAHKLLNRES